MDILRAYAILGVDSSTPLDAVKQRYKMRAQMLHPDRHAGRPELHAEAEAAMADLNQAWELIEDRALRGPSHDDAETSSVSSNEATEELRPPFEGECDLCGCRPAKRITLRSITGLLLGWRHQKIRPDLCRNCGISLFRETQSANLLKGWWSILGLYVNLYAIIANAWAVERHRRTTPQPAYRDPSVVTPLPPGLESAASVFRRPAPILSTIAALAVFAALGAASSSGDTSQSDGQGEEDAVGRCLDFDGGATDCSGPEARWRIVQETTTQTVCIDRGLDTFEASDGTLYCAERM